MSVPGPAQWRRFQNFATQRLAFLGSRLRDNEEIYRSLARRTAPRTRSPARNMQILRERLQEMRVLMVAINEDRAQITQLIRRLIGIEPM